MTRTPKKENELVVTNMGRSILAAQSQPSLRPVATLRDASIMLIEP